MCFTPRLIHLKRKKEKVLISADRRSVTEVSLSEDKYVFVCMYIRIA